MRCFFAGDLDRAAAASTTAAPLALPGDLLLLLPGEGFGLRPRPRVAARASAAGWLCVCLIDSNTNVTMWYFYMCGLLMMGLMLVTLALTYACSNAA